MARIVRLRGIVCTLAAGGVALAAPVAYGASAGFSGNVCKILTKSQVATLHVPTSCAQLKPTKSSLGTVTTAVWGVGKITGPDVSVAVWKVTNSAFLPALEASHA